MDGLDRFELMAFEGADKFVVEGIDAARHAERAVAHVPAGPAGDLAKLGRAQLAELKAVELPVRREGDVIDVEVEPHADRVGGDEEIDVARLEQLDLGVPGARTERAEDDGGAAALAPDQLGDGVNLVAGEGHRRRPPGEPGDLLRSRPGEHRHPRPCHDIGSGQELRDDAAHGRRAEEQRLLAAAKMQDAVGEDVAALEVAGKLDLVDREERGVGLGRHRFDRADPVAGLAGHDLLFAGDQRHLIDADPRGDAVIDLAGEQAERQADHPALVPEHPLDGEMGLAGIGGASTATTPRPRLAAGPEKTRRLMLIVGAPIVFPVRTAGSPNPASHYGTKSAGNFRFLRRI